MRVRKYEMLKYNSWFFLKKIIIVGNKNKHEGNYRFGKKQQRRCVLY